MAKYLEINACVDCPHHEVDNLGLEYVDDMFGIRCVHPNQSCKDRVQAKIKNKHNNIYFNCPLDDEQSILNLREEI